MGGKNMDHNLQKYFAWMKTVEYGSFTKAAEILHYSQSGISRMIADLEQEWELSLLERGKTGVRLTSDGTELLPYIRELCRAAEGLEEKVDELNGLQSGLIRIGTFSSVATHWLPNIIREFQKDYPNIDYELLLGDYTEIEEWVRMGRVDCGFLRLPAHRDFSEIFLEEDPLLAILPEKHPFCHMEKIPLQALCEEPFLLLEKGGKSEVSTIFEQHGLHPKIKFTTWDDYAVMSMVESGLGISILPQLILKRVPYRIVAKKLDVPATRRIGLILRDPKTASFAVKQFLRYLPYREGRK